MWKFSTDNAIVAMPLIHDDTLFIGSWDGRMHAISIKKQQVLWKFKTLYDNLNFDVTTALQHITVEEEKSRQIFSVWKPETTQTTQRSGQRGLYGLGNDTNETSSGSDSDQKRFFYSGQSEESSYKTKRGYTTKDLNYK